MIQNIINVTKRDGVKEGLDLEKFHRVAAYACDGLNGVSASELEIKTHIQFYNNIKTVDVQEMLIKAAADLITEESPNYQYVARPSYQLWAAQRSLWSIRSSFVSRAYY